MGVFGAGGACVQFMVIVNSVESKSEIFNRDDYI